MRSIKYDKTLDINECQSTSLNRCQQQCINTIGSYKCGCNTGYQLSHDGKTCTGKSKTDMQVNTTVFNTLARIGANA